MPHPLSFNCILTCNSEKYLQEALDSINQQTFIDFEVVVSDDSSSDDTLKCHLKI